MRVMCLATSCSSYQRFVRQCRQIPFVLMRWDGSRMSDEDRRRVALLVPDSPACCAMLGMAHRLLECTPKPRIDDWRGPQFSQQADSRPLLDCVAIGCASRLLGSLAVYHTGRHRPALLHERRAKSRPQPLALPGARHSREGLAPAGVFPELADACGQGQPCHRQGSAPP